MVYLGVINLASHDFPRTFDQMGVMYQPINNAIRECGVADLFMPAKPGAAKLGSSSAPGNGPLDFPEVAALGLTQR
jgi:hypothetical protein